MYVSLVIVSELICVHDIKGHYIHYIKFKNAIPITILFCKFQIFFLVGKRLNFHQWKDGVDDLLSDSSH